MNMDKVSVYYLDPINSSVQLLNISIIYWTSALLRGLQKMAASKPIS